MRAMPSESASNDAAMAPPSAPVALEGDPLDLPLSAVRSFELVPGVSDSENHSDSDPERSRENAPRREAVSSAPTLARAGAAVKNDKKDKKEKKHKKDTKNKKKTFRPPLLNNRTGVTKVAKNAGKDASSGGTSQKKESMRKVFQAVAEYVEEHPDSWTPSIMREEISDKYGWENNGEFLGHVKAAIHLLGVTSDGQLKAA